MILPAHTLAPLAGSLIALIIIALLLRHRTRHRRRQRLLLGLTWLDSLRQLLAHFQQHRGLSSGYIAGNGDLLPQIQQLQSQIRRDFENVTVQGSWITQNSRWIGIEEHWNRLSATYQSLDRDSNISQHNRMLTNLIYLIEDTAEAHDLKLLCDGHDHGQRVWRDLLIVAEHIGQARAIGTAITASGHCDSVSRIQMSYLSEKIEETSLNLWGNLDMPQHARHKLQELLSCIKQRVMQDHPEIESQIYFKLASGCLEDVLAQFDQEMALLRQRME